jgi:hypothetical protein
VAAVIGAVITMPRSKVIRVYNDLWNKWKSK